ncbi:MAG: 2-phospho-L-lactate transferase CofD family protein [Promethearchaeota archaeon]
MISILASGKESLKFLNGFLQIVSPKDVDVNVIVDIFDFFNFYDIRIYPQLTNVLLLFMNQLNENRWTGKHNDSLEISNFLHEIDEDFPTVKELDEVGDHFLAPNIFITHWLQKNRQLSTCINEISKNITKASVMPLSNDELELKLGSTELSEDEEPGKQKISMASIYDAFESITLSQEAQTAILNSEVVLIPKPPVRSILAILRIQHFQESLKNAVGQIVFVSPITETELDSDSLLAFKETRLTPSAIGLSKVLRGLVDVHVIDKTEEPLKNRITRYGMNVVSYPLNIDTPKNQLEVVEEVLKLTPFREVVESLEYKAKREVDSLKHGFKKFVGGLKRKF